MRSHDCRESEDGFGEDPRPEARMTVPAADVLRLLSEALADDARRVLRALADPSLAPEPGLERLALTAWNAAVMLCDELRRRAGESDQ